MSRNPAPLHHPADDRDHLGAEPDVALEALAPEVEPAVADPQRLVDVLVVELERERRAGGDDLEPFDLELDLARRQARVDVLRCTGCNLALGLEDELVADVVRRGGRFGSVLGVDDELADARRVAEVDEDEAAMVAALGHPAGKRVALTDVLGPGLPRSKVSPAHGASLAGNAASETVSSWAPRFRIVAPCASTTTIVSAPTRPA